MSREEKMLLAIKKGITCNPKTGQIFGIRGDVINSICSHGYGRVNFIYRQKQYNIKSHQFIWYIVNREIVDCIDHINGNKLDNRIDNLRSVTKQENSFNKVTSKGYWWSKDKKKWCSYIWVNQKKIHLGYFVNEVDARQTYLEAKDIYHKIEKGTQLDTP